MSRYRVTTHREGQDPRSMNIILSDDPETEEIRMRYQTNLRIGEDIEKKEIKSGYEFVSTENPNDRVVWVLAGDSNG